MHGYLFYGQLCDDVLGFLLLKNDARSPCAFVLNYVSRKSLGAGIYQNADKRALDALKNTIRLVNMRHMKKIIRANLKKPKTIFVSPSAFLDKDWSYFRKVMRSDKQLKRMASRRVSMHGIMFQDGLKGQ